MFKANYKATMKALFRSPVTLLAFGATVILTLALYEGGTNGLLTSLFNVRQEIWNDVHTTCYNLFPPFLGMMISAHILVEKENRFGDLLVSSRKSILTIYLSKLCAIGTVTLVARALFLAANICSSFGDKYTEAIALGYDSRLPLGKIVAHYAVFEVVFVPFMLLCFTAMPVFITVVTNKTITGAVWNVCFYLAGFLWDWFKASDFHLPPMTVKEYTSVFNHIDNPELMADKLNRLVELSRGKMAPTLQDTLTVYIGWIVFSLALLTAAYFILKRRYRT